MYFSNNSFLLLLLFAFSFQPGQSAPSQKLENEEIKDSEDYIKSFKDDQTEQELDTSTLGVYDDQTVSGTDVTEGPTVGGTDVSEEETVSGRDVTEGISAATDPQSPSASLDHSSGEEEGIPRTTMGEKELLTENVHNETPSAESSSTTLPNEDTSQESETTLNGVPSESEGHEPSEPEGSKAPESDASELSGATDPSENVSSTKIESTISITSSLDGNLSIIEDGTSDNNSQSHEGKPDSNDSESGNKVSDESEPSKDDSELDNSTTTENYMQEIQQFQDQDFSKGTTESKEEIVTWESMTSAGEGQGSLYLGSSSDESSGADSGLQVEDQQQQQEQEEGGEEIEESSRSLLSRWWLWLLMLCLGLGLGLFCKARINARQGEAEYLRMGERFQGSTITIPR